MADIIRADTRYCNIVYQTSRHNHMCGYWEQPTTTNKCQYFDVDARIQTKSTVYFCLFYSYASFQHIGFIESFVLCLVFRHSNDSNSNQNQILCKYFQCTKQILTGTRNRPLKPASKLFKVVPHAEIDQTTHIGCVYKYDAPFDSPFSFDLRATGKRGKYSIIQWKFFVFISFHFDTRY